MLLNESPYGAGIFPILCTIRQVLRRSFRLIANAIPLPMILRRSFRFPNDQFGFIPNRLLDCTCSTSPAENYSISQPGML